MADINLNINNDLKEKLGTDNVNINSDKPYNGYKTQTQKYIFDPQKQEYTIILNQCDLI